MSSRLSGTKGGHFSVIGFNEPSVTGDENFSLKTTGQNIGESPDSSALTALEDPERVKRQQIRQPKVRRFNRPADEQHSEKNGYGRNSAEKSEERLMFKLKRGLASANETRPAYSFVRENPDKGKEDYRHLRADKSEYVDFYAESRAARKATKEAAAKMVKSHEGKKIVRSDNALLAEIHNRQLADPELMSPRARRSRRSKRPVDYGVAPEEDETVVSEPETIPVEPKKRRFEKKESKEHLKEQVKIVKDEPQEAKPSKEIVNNDYCASCGGTGELLCCETCVRSFHFSCIEPPVMSVDQITEDLWSCRKCHPQKLSEGDLRVDKSLFKDMILSLESGNAVAFQLPSHLRDMFSNVQTTKYGEFIDEFRKTDSVGMGPRIQDKNGQFLLCFKCKGSGLHGQPIAVCSECSETWHVDCVEPALESTPLGYWVCPLHANSNVELPRRVNKPHFRSVALRRQIPNSGDIEIEDDEETEDGEGDRENAGSFSDEETIKHVPFIAPTKVAADGTLVARYKRTRPRGFYNDCVVYKLPSSTIKLDFVDAIYKRRTAPIRETPASDFMYALDILADKPQPECEAVRNLMSLKLQGSTVDTATAKGNLHTLIDAALNDENEIGQIAAIRRLMQEKGRERLLELLM